MRAWRGYERGSGVGWRVQKDEAEVEEAVEEEAEVEEEVKEEVEGQVEFREMRLPSEERDVKDQLVIV